MTHFYCSSTFRLTPLNAGVLNNFSDEKLPGLSTKIGKEREYSKRRRPCNVASCLNAELWMHGHVACNWAFFFNTALGFAIDQLATGSHPAPFVSLWKLTLELVREVKNRSSYSPSTHDHTPWRRGAAGHGTLQSQVHAQWESNGLLLRICRMVKGGITIDTGRSVEVRYSGEELQH